MKASRRSFLGMLVATPVAGAGAPLVKIIPVAPAVASPVAAVTAGNTIISPDVIAREALRLLQDNLQMARLFSRSEGAQ